MTRVTALLLALFLVLPRAALGAVMLHCGQAAEREKCCCCHRPKKPAPEPRLERAPCCSTATPSQAPSTPAIQQAKPALPALALAAVFESSAALGLPELVADVRAKLARGPPPRKVPIFLSHCTLLQ